MNYTLKSWSMISPEELKLGCPEVGINFTKNGERIIVRKFLINW